MQYHGGLADLEDRIEARVGDFAYRRRLYQGHDDAAAIVVKEGRLDDDDVRNAIAMLAGIPMNVELRHQSVECSSENEPPSSAKRFQIATVSRTKSASAARRCFS
jgi:hypothetical protein